MKRGWRRRLIGGRINAALGICGVAFATLLYVPAVLAFPYRTQIGTTSVLSERPVDPHIGAVLTRADRLLAASPLNRPGLHRQVVLTDGGWRWRVLALSASGAFALRRPFSSVLVVNRNDVASDRVFNPAPVANERSLSGAIAHETMHLLVARHLGEWGAAFLPTWKLEGYADHVAQESSVRAGDEARIRAIDPHAPALVYYDGRRRVAAELASNGGSVDRLFGR